MCWIVNINYCKYVEEEGTEEDEKEEAKERDEENGMVQR